MARRELAKMAKIVHGGLRCHSCGKLLNVKNLEYTPKRWPLGLVEFVPTCRECANDGENHE